MSRALHSIRPILALIELGIRSFFTHRMHPLAPQWTAHIIRCNELRNPMPRRTR